MKLGEIIQFRKDLFFEGAVQSDWFYSPAMASKVAENFIFHGKDYFGKGNRNRKNIDTISLTLRLTEKLNNDKTEPFSLAISDYGTGKSHFAVTLAEVLSGPNYNPDTYDTVLENIEKIDRSAASAIARNCSSDNFVIVLNGIKDANLHYEILHAVQRSFVLYNLNPKDLMKLNRSLETANMFFERNKNSQLSLFEQEAKTKGWTDTGAKLIERIERELSAGQTAFEIVNSVYSLTNGKPISWDEDISAHAILDLLLTEYIGPEKPFANLIIIFDEFGRYLEYASAVDSARSGDAALQQIFEIINDNHDKAQMINFIQADIKTYLNRVDQTKNISRYIGRYDKSEKFYVSSNLETVFANLIYRSDKEAFARSVVRWQKNREGEWTSLHAKMNKWLDLDGVWADYSFFRSVVVEGIYPLHPLAAYLPARLSDYLQNRSSITLIAEYIESIADEEITESHIPMIYPEQMMKGDLFSEMLSAESSGRQHSQHCILYDTILRKHGDKLSESCKAVLRANLINRVLGFKTTSYEELKDSLMICTSLSKKDFDGALDVLENEYALLSFDSYANCFDFMEEARGMHDYKVKKKLMRAFTSKPVFTQLFQSAKILEIAKITDDLPTNFGTIHQISTNEWVFPQELIASKTLSKELINQWIQEWKSKTSVSDPKGKIVWIYLEKTADESQLTRLEKAAKLLQGTPIVLMLLNDAEDKLKNALTEFHYVDQLSDDIRRDYARYFEEDLNTVTNQLTKTFEELKMKRLIILPETILSSTKRMGPMLTDVLNNVYPDVISFKFDGYMTSRNNVAQKFYGYYCQILKMLLGNSTNFDTIHNFVIDVKNRINALLMENNHSSWKCISQGYSIIPPKDPKARNIYDLVVEELRQNGKYYCGDFFEIYTQPPYGLSNDSAMLLLAVIIANNYDSIRIQVNTTQKSPSQWKELVIVNDKRIDLKFVKSSCLLYQDIEQTTADLKDLLSKINSSKDISAIKSLFFEAKNYVDQNGLPESLEQNYNFARSQMNSAEKAEGEWNVKISSCEELLQTAEKNKDVSKAYKALADLRKISINNIFIKCGLECPDSYQKARNSMIDQADRLINDNFETWVNRVAVCKSVEDINRFQISCKKHAKSLSELGYSDKADLLLERSKNEIERVKKAQVLNSWKTDLKTQISRCKQGNRTSVYEIDQLITQSKNVLVREQEFANIADNATQNLVQSLEKQIQELDKASENIWRTVDKAKELVKSASTLADLKKAKKNLAQVQTYKLPEEMLSQLEKIEDTINLYIKDIDEVLSHTKNREELTDAVNKFREKYKDTNPRP